MKITDKNKLNLIEEVNMSIVYNPKELSKTVMAELITLQQTIIHNIYHQISDTDRLNDLCFMLDAVADTLESRHDERVVMKDNYFCIPETKKLKFTESDSGALTVQITGLLENEKDVLASHIRDLIRVMNFWKPAE